MKKFLTVILAFLTLFLVSCGGKDEYVLNETDFFIVMTNVTYYPEKYVGKNLEFDCFTYSLTDVDGNEYLCGVRKCSAGYGCKCGKDTVIGFILDYDGDIPQPKNQSEDTNDKSWIHLKGSVKSKDFTEIKIYAYNGDEIDVSSIETIKLLTYKVDTLDIIEDYSGLNYYVTK